MANLVTVLQNRAARFPHEPAYLFLDQDEEEKDALSYGELDERARRIAAFLQKKNKLGDRVLLIYPPGADFIAGFMGCLYAGMIAVPAHLSKLDEFKKAQSYLKRIADDAEIRLILTDNASYQEVKKIFIGGSTKKKTLKIPAIFRTHSIISCQRFVLRRSPICNIPPDPHLCRKPPLSPMKISTLV